MKLWHISQTHNRAYDTYDSAVVAAETEEDARRIHPNTNIDTVYDGDRWKHASLKWWCVSDDWVADLSLITVRLIGEAVEGTQPGAICASFNAG